MNLKDVEKKLRAIKRHIDKSSAHYQKCIDSVLHLHKGGDYVLNLPAFIKVTKKLPDQDIDVIYIPEDVQKTLIEMGVELNNPYFK